MQLVLVGRQRTDEDGCRRYMADDIWFDTRFRMMNNEINTEWEPEIIAQHEEKRRQIRMLLIHEFGNTEHERKIEDYCALGAAPWSVIDRHNLFISQIRDSFTYGV